jgi:MFS transporter, MHS family, proline/betaine transporter
MLMDEQTARSKSSASSDEVDARLRRRSVFAVAAGNMLEFYDFAAYSSLAPILGPIFFPVGNPITALIASLSVFAVGFFARPLGAIVFGRLGDIKGRRFALFVVITLMGASTLLIGVMPTYASAGILAPILLVFVRIVQGLSLGGEFGTSVSYLVEIAPRGKRGLYGSLVYLTSQLGFALGLAIVYGGNIVLGAESMSAWAWRIPFMLSLPLVLIGMYLRSRTPETPAFSLLAKEHQLAESPVTSAVKTKLGAMARVLGLMVAFTFISYTVLAFVLSYLLVVRKVPGSVAYPSLLLLTVISALLTPVVGALSDHWGRRPLLIGGAVFQTFFSVPAFLLMDSGGFAAITAGQCLLWIPNIIFSGCFPAVYAELFPTRLRSTGVNIAVAVATAIFSGTTPLVMTLLVQTTGSHISPAIYLIVGAIVTLGFLWTLPESAHRDLPST